MSMNNRKIAGFMSAESIYSLAFYIVMVAAIAGVGASVLTNKDSAKAAAAISLLRANYVAESAGLGYTPVSDAPAVIRMSGNLLVGDAVPATTATLPGGSGAVTLVGRTLAPALGGFSINVRGIQKPAICSAIAGVGFGTWAAVGALAGAGPFPGAGSNVPDLSKPALKAICDAATAAAANQAHLIFVSE